MEARHGPLTVEKPRQASSYSSESSHFVFYEDQLRKKINHERDDPPLGLGDGFFPLGGSSWRSG